MSEEQPTQRPPTPVIVTDVKIPFDSMMWLIIKFVLAGIPAGIVLLLIAVIGGMLLSAAGIHLFRP